MSPLEICLIIIGIICIIVSFIFVPENDKNNAGSYNAELSKEQMENITKQVNDIIEEQLETLEEKTEISMDKISNKKIMELSEYSDTVLAQIGKNHEETMFLYDMLNGKTKEVKNVIRDLDKVSSVMKETAVSGEMLTTVEAPKEEKPKTTRRRTKAKDVVAEEGTVTVTSEALTEEQPKKTRKRTTKAKSTSTNNNDKILELYKEGMPVMDIAKTLGLGIGEVKLVIELFNN